MGMRAISVPQSEHVALMHWFAIHLKLKRFLGSKIFQIMHLITAEDVLENIYLEPLLGDSCSLGNVASGSSGEQIENTEFWFANKIQEKSKPRVSFSPHQASSEAGRVTYRINTFVFMILFKDLKWNFRVWFSSNRKSIARV